MANKIAHQMALEAESHFNDIDTRHTGSLNLVDITRYENQGAEQRKLGQFLEDNFTELQGISQRDLDLGHHTNIKMDDLKFVDLLSGDQPAIDKKFKSDLADNELFGVTTGLVVASSASFMAAMNTHSAWGVPLFFGMEASAGYGGYVWRKNLVTDHYKLQQDIVGKMNV
jgi:hypothetical protein